MKSRFLVCLLLGVIAVAGVFAEESRAVSFGLITDTHVCDKADQSSAISVNASQASKDDVQTKLINTGVPAGQAYYSFTKGNVHFIVLDAGFKSDGTAYAAAVRSALEARGKVVAVFSGHYHDGGFQTVNGISYVVLQANAAYGNEASYHNQYATVDVYADGKNVKPAVAGNGMQKSYVVKAVIK